MMTNLKDIDRVILYAVFTAPARELVMSGLGHNYILQDYYRRKGRKTPTYYYLYDRIQRLIELGVLTKKSERPIRVGVNHKYYKTLNDYITIWVKAYLATEKKDED